MANLVFGVEAFLRFAEGSGAISADERASLSRRCWAALGESAADQADEQMAGDPARRFIELLSAALTSGRAHVASQDGAAPPNPRAWGWREETFGSVVTWRPEDGCIGWLVGDAAAADLYLSSDAAIAAARLLGRDSGDPLAVHSRTLHKRLQQAGLLKSTEDDRGRLTVRRSLAGKRRAVLHLSASLLEATAQPSQTAQRPPVQAQAGPQDWAVAADGADPNAPQSAAASAQLERDEALAGPDGPLVPLPEGRTEGPVDIGPGRQQTLGWTQPTSGEPDLGDDWGTVG